MYSNYFGLSELPFSIAPNPHFMFMSDRHREALNHLTYGFGETGGFALLTGEVGTGKTTISRCLLEQIPESTQVAFILNPTLSAQELLATICDELKIRYRKTGVTTKILTDKIQEKLLANHSNQINTLLIIDEAQHLQAEVLEQLRLLTNLETNTKKLLQVILIGQPELQQLLQRQDLRQLAQRITARYHLMPLNKQEVAQYVKHRLDIAKCPRKLFSDRALAKIHQITGGIPRLINLLCDRSLSLAYGNNHSMVEPKIVVKAAEQAFGQNITTGSTSLLKQPVAWASLLVLTIFSALYTGYWFSGTKNELVANVSGDTVGNSPTTTLPITSLSSTTVASPTTAIVPDISHAANKGNNISTDVLAEQRMVNEKLLEKLSEMENKLSVISQSQKAETLLTATQAPVQQTSNTQQVSSAVVNTLSVNNPSVNSQALATNTEMKVISGANKPLPKFTVSATEGVSDKMLSLFQTALDETTPVEKKPETKVAEPIAAEIKSLYDMPTWLQDAIPTLKFEMHIYASDNQGWIKVNGQEKFQGDMLAPQLQLVRIDPQQVILDYQGEIFSLPSLTYWQ